MAVEGYSNQDWAAAGKTLEGTYSPTQLFTAEDEIKTEAALFADETEVAVLTILAFNATNELVAWDPTAVQAVVGGAVDQNEAAPEAKPIGVAAADMDTTDATGTSEATFGPYYVGGCFNPDLLVWPAGLATYKARQAALAGAPFRIKRLL